LLNSAETNLARFADEAGLRHDLLGGEQGYEIEHAPADFDGRIAALRIVSYGRFGNVFYQTLHALLLAPLLGCRTVFASPRTEPQPEPSLERDGLRIVFRAEAGMDRIEVPTLAGHFFDPTPFRTALGAVPPAAAWEVVQRYLVPMSRDVLDRAAPVGRQTLVMSFRSGDIFASDDMHPFYVQPPASYYMRAMAYARERLGVTDARLVFEDDGNPAIGCVQAKLQSQGIPFTVQSSSMIDDLTCLLGASHLAAPFSTFAEAAAMLSERLESYFAFRNFESHQKLRRREPPLLLDVLRRKNVRAVLIDDATGSYIPALTWENSPAQRRQIVAFPMDSLVVLEGEAAEAREIGQPDPDWRADLAASRQEAVRLRGLMLAGRAEMRACEAMFRRSVETLRQEVRTLADHLDASRRREADAQALLRQTQDALSDMEAAFRASTSWRATAPLRWLARTLRGTA
jgi:hypothetical protein